MGVRDVLHRSALDYLPSLCEELTFGRTAGCGWVGIVNTDKTKHPINAFPVRVKLGFP